MDYYIHIHIHIYMILFELFHINYIDIYIQNGANKQTKKKRKRKHKTNNKETTYE